MLEGVNVIKKEEIFETEPWRDETESWRDYMYSWLRAVVAIMVVYYIAVILNKFLEFPRFIAFIFWTLAGIVTVGFFIFVVHVTKHAKKIPTGRYRYIVNIAPEVSYTELTEFYDVTNNNDGTYTLEEKERERKEEREENNLTLRRRE